MTAFGNFNEFVEKSTDEIDGIIMDPTFKTTKLIAMAKEYLATFGRDISRLERSEIKLSKPVDPYLVLLSLLDSAPTERGARYVAATIVLCSRNSSTTCEEGITSLIRLSDYFLRYLLLACKAGSARRLSKDQPRSNEEQQAHFRQGLLQRDAYRCILLEDNHEPCRKLVAAHILNPTIAMYKTLSTVPITWNIILRYAGWMSVQSEMVSKLDELDNGMILSRDLSDKFNQFSWALKPAFDLDRIVPNTYKVDIIDNSQFSTYDLLSLEGKVTTFVDNSSPPPPPVGISSLNLTSPPPPRLALPHPEFLAFHRALGHILHKSGAGEAINATFERLRKARVKIPSKQMHDMDGLCIILAFCNPR